MVHKNPLYRKAKLNDIDKLVELRKILLSQGKTHYASTTPEEERAWIKAYLAWLSQFIKRNDKINIVVSGPEDTIDACAIGIIDDRAPMKGCLNGKTGWIQTMVVDPSMRKQGRAQRLLEFLLEWFKSNNVDKVFLQTTDMANEFYSKMGFVNSGEDLLYKILL